MGKMEDKFLQIVIAFLSATPDPQFQQIVNELASRNFQWNLLKGIRMSSKESSKVGPAGSVGIFFNGPIGFIFLANHLETHFTYDEIRFIVGHEMSHIARSHVISRYMTSFFEEILAELFSKQLVSLFKGLFYLRGQHVLDQKVVRENELEADRDAVSWVGNREVGISTLEKLVRYYANGNLDSPSHFAPLGRLQLPVVTFRERINNLRSFY
jgi:Zn-dependent protease with chaperone function